MRARTVAIALSLASCDHADRLTPSGTGATALSPRTVIDAGTLSRCVVSYTCGMSHPGLGSSSQTTSVDLATCIGTASSQSGPWEPAPTDATVSTTSSAPLSAEACTRLRQLTLAITEDDAREQEAAPVDTTACTLTVTCAPDLAPTLSIQRQTTSGPSRVAQVIRAVQAR